MAHVHIIVDHDKHFIIDPITKKIQPENPEKNKLVRYDHNSERYTFEMDRMLEGHDMSLCDIVQIHYINVSSNKQKKNEDIYEVNDLGLLSGNEDRIAFTWLVSRNATMLDGILTFAIRFACSNGDSIDYELHTEIFSSISISNTIINNGQSIVEEYSDILNQWKKELFGIEGTIQTAKRESLAAIDKNRTDSLNAINSDSRKALDAINLARENSLEAIDRYGLVQVSEEEPTNPNIDVHINPNATESFTIPEIIDDSTGPEDTWSSKKINAELSKVNADVTTLKEDLTRLDVLDLAMVREEIGTERIKVDDIIHKSYGEVWDFTSVEISSSATKVITLAIDDLHIPTTGELRVYTTNPLKEKLRVKTKGIYVVDLGTDLGLKLQLQVSKEIACEAGIYYAKGIQIFTGDITPKKQGLPDYFTGTDVIKERLSKAESVISVNKNLFSLDTITPDKYINHNDGILRDNTDYFVTDKIYVKEGEKIWHSCPVRFIAAFDRDEKIMPEKGAEQLADIDKHFLIHPGVDYVRITISTRYINSNIMINSGDKLYPYDEYGKRYIDQNNLDKQTQNILKSCIKTSLNGGNSVKKETSLLVANAELQIPEFPYNLKKGIGMTFYSKFTNFTSIEIGKGRNKYRGDSIEITTSSVKWIKYDEGTYSVAKTIDHGLTISKFLSVHIYIGNDRKCHYAIETFNDIFKGMLDNWTEMNGVAFVVGKQPMTEVELSAIALDIKCPVWLFGDSYFGVSENRVIGQLKNLGFCDNVLISGLAGMGSPGAYEDNLVKLVAMGGLPKYIVWCEGMNDNASNYAKYINMLTEFCEQNSIELIFYRIPTVPSRVLSNNECNAIMLSANCRYIDAYKAVGADDAGNWYPGYLDTDGIHPTTIGAKAIAHRIIIDLPEIMQYGYDKGDVFVNISDNA